MDKGITGYMKPIVATLIILIVINPAKAQTTQFTYQGKLSDGGAPANGSYDFQFGLFDTATVGTGSQLGTTQTLTGVGVSGGLFTVQLDFGACPACFNGAARFLEIAVKKTLGGTFTTLGPRQPITSTPYAIKSQNAANATTADGLSVACVNCVTSNQISSLDGSKVNGAIPVASVPTGSANYVQNTTSPQASSNFNISGNGTAAGTLAGNAVNAATQYNLGGSRVLSTAGTGNLFAGVNAGTANTGSLNSFFGGYAGSINSTGSDNAFFGGYAGASNSTGNGNAFFGRYAGLTNSTGSNTTILGSNAGLSNTTESDNTFVGASSNGAAGITNATAIGSRAAVSQSNSLVLGSISGVNGATASVNVGIGTTAPTSRLHVVGDINTTTQYNLGGNRMLAVSGVGSYVNMNTFAGVGAGISTTPSEDGLGSFNAFFGFQAGLLNTAGSDNSFFGFQAGRNNTTGVVNSFFGQEAGKNNTTGSENSFFGSNAGLLNTTGSDNSFFGRAAGFYNTTGSENSFFGRYAGVDNGEGFSNTFIGYGADFTILNSTGNFNTLLGTFSRVTAGVSNATAIGARATVTQSNSLVLGSINGVSGATADTNVGIGTTAPSFRLHVRVAGQDGIKIQHNGTGDYPQIRWTDASDAFKASIGVGPVGSEGMHFFVNGADRLIIENTGTLWLSNLGAAGSTQLCLNASNQIATCSSSLRYKTDIQPFAGGLEIIHRLHPISFTWKQGGLGDLGLAAEEVAEVEPLLVTHNDKGEVEGVKYDRINVLLINAIKQQQAQIQQQQQQNDLLQQQLERQQHELETLKRLVCLSQPQAAACQAQKPQQ